MQHHPHPLTGFLGSDLLGSDFRGTNSLGDNLLGADPLGPTTPSGPPTTSTRRCEIGGQGATAWRTGRVMGTDCQVRVAHAAPRSAAAAADAAWQLLVRLDHCWSRFRLDSELSAFNRYAGRAVDGDTIDVSSEMAALLSAMTWAYSYSDGWVDASLLPEVIAAGYDVDIAEVKARAGRVEPSATGGSTDRWSRLEHLYLGADRCTFTGPVVVDSGGVGKGLAADLVSQVVMSDSASGTVINLGGDIRAVGCDHDGRPWRVTVQSPAVAPPLGGDDPFLAEWFVSDAGVATSSTDLRRWAGGHHLIDPWTRRPSETDVVTVSVVHAEALAAEVATKTALLMGSNEGLDWLRDHNLAAVVVTRDGRVTRVKCA